LPVFISKIMRNGIILFANKINQICAVAATGPVAASSVAPGFVIVGLWKSLGFPIPAP